MRTTLNIDDDLLAVAQDIARSERRSLGDVVSEAMRKGLAAGTLPVGVDDPDDDVLRDMGIHPIPRRGVVVTNELVNRIRDEEGM